MLAVWTPPKLNLKALTIWVENYWGRWDFQRAGKTHTQLSLLPHDFSGQSSLAKNRLKICCYYKVQLNLNRKINSYQNNFKACYVCLKVIKFSSFPFIFCSFFFPLKLQADLKDLSRRFLDIILIRQWCAFENNSKHADLRECSY